ncbi:MAG: DNA-deoxyinosine glycosylase [Butyrivibrio sp.]|jgi:hypoxanthine-DNA glycosylase|nr:DNA-deoxyinosine glycosylase [Butyrivibrio sp.]
MITHPFPPLYDENSEILILGSFPSVKSREMNFFYGHPQNRFWKVMSTILQEPLPVTVTEKKAMLLGHHIALFDVIRSCDIEGSSDSSIRNVQVNDLSDIIKTSRIGNRIYVNGNKARDLYMKYTLPQTGIPCITLPSTSPANAAFSVDRLVRIWGEKLDVGKALK